MFLISQDYRWLRFPPIVRGPLFTFGVDFGFELGGVYFEMVKGEESPTLDQIKAALLYHYKAMKHE